MTHVTMDIRNNSDSEVTNANFDFRARNTNNQPLSTTSTNISLKSGDLEQFLVSFSNSDSDPASIRYVSRVDYTISYNDEALIFRTMLLETMPTGSAPTFEIVGGRVSRGEFRNSKFYQYESFGADARITIEVINNGNAAASNISVTVTLRDPDGDFLGRVRNHPVGEIAAGDSEGVFVIIEDVFPEMDPFEQEIDLEQLVVEVSID